MYHDAIRVTLDYSNLVLIHAFLDQGLLVNVLHLQDASSLVDLLKLNLSQIVFLILTEMLRLFLVSIHILTLMIEILIILIMNCP